MALRLMLSVNDPWNLVNYRRGLIEALIGRGYEIIAVTPPGKDLRQVAEMGCHVIELPMDKKGVNPLRELRLLLGYVSVMGRVRPDAYLGWTVKPNVYGSLAAGLFGVPVVNNISGLGTAFMRPGLLRHVVTGLYRLALARSRTVFLQNADDLALLRERGIIDLEQAQLLPGSGVDLTRFSPAPVQKSDGEPTTFLFIGRLIRDKGVCEYVEAARRLRAMGIKARFRILGFTGVQNRTAISRAEIDQWSAEGVIEYIGHADDVRPAIADADCVVLPSYREGTSRALLEAAAMARPLIVTDVPGCREVVDQGINGFLCGAQDVESLAGRMETFASLPLERITDMGRASRLKAEREFDEAIVIGRYVRALERIFATRPPALQPAPAG